MPPIHTSALPSYQRENEIARVRREFQRDYLDAIAIVCEAGAYPGTTAEDRRTERIVRYLRASWDTEYREAGRN